MSTFRGMIDPTYQALAKDMTILTQELRKEIEDINKSSARVDAELAKIDKSLRQAKNEDEQFAALTELDETYRKDVFNAISFISDIEADVMAGCWTNFRNAVDGKSKLTMIYYGRFKAYYARMTAISIINAKNKLSEILNQQLRMGDALHFSTVQSGGRRKEETGHDSSLADGE